MTTIVDYGAGNLRSVQNALDELGARYEVTNRPETVRKAERIILPGVGHFGQMMRAVDELGLRAPLLERIGTGVPFLGICVGLQCLFTGSEEAPGSQGLGVFPGMVKRFVGELHGFLIWAGTRWSGGPFAGCSKGLRTGRLLILRTATTCRR